MLLKVNGSGNLRATQSYESIKRNKPSTVLIITGFLVHLCAIAGYAYFVIAEPVRRGTDGGIPSSQTSVLVDAIVFSLFPGLVFSIIQHQSIKYLQSLAAHLMIAIAYAVVWSVSAYLTAWDYRVLFGNTWTEFEVLCGLVLAQRDSLLIMLSASIINAILFSWSTRGAGSND